jgi:hypothetical protein
VLSFSDIINIIKQGSASVIALLIVSISLLFSRRLRFPDEVDNERQRRLEEVKYRDDIIANQREHIDSQAAQIDRLQDNFEVALKSIREELIPLLREAISTQGGTRSIT